MLNLDCECGNTFAVPDSRAGRDVQCPRCKLAFLAPAVRSVQEPEMSPEEARKILSGIALDILRWILLLPIKAAFGLVAVFFRNPIACVFLILVAMGFYAINCHHR